MSTTDAARGELAPDYTYIAVWWPTATNSREQREAEIEDPTITHQRAFDDPVEASAWFIERGIFPFVVERIPYVEKKA